LRGPGNSLGGGGKLGTEVGSDVYHFAGGSRRSKNEGRGCLIFPPPKITEDWGRGDQPGKILKVWGREVRRIVTAVNLGTAVPATGVELEKTGFRGSTEPVGWGPMEIGSNLLSYTAKKVGGKMGNRKI